MKFSPLALVLACSGFVLAGAPDADSKARLRQFQDDRTLVEFLVTQGLELADESDSLKRAQSFHGLAKSLFHEIEQAAEKNQEPRALRMGNYLQTVLVRGLADNLSMARGQIAAQSAREAEWRRLADQALKLTQPLLPQSQLEPTSARKILESAGRVVQPGRAALQKVLGEKGRTIRLPE